MPWLFLTDMAALSFLLGTFGHDIVGATFM